VVVAAKSTTPQPTLPGTIFTVADEARKLGVRALPVKVDIRNDAEVDNMVDATVKEFGRVDFLICNSGALWWKNVDATPMSKYDLVQGVNARGTFACVAACLPHMRRQNFGRVVVMSPPVDSRLLKGHVAYCISKFGMTMIAEGVAKETEGTGISANALWPATLIESFATRNFQMGETDNWRKADIIADATVMILQDDSKDVRGKALIDEEYLYSRGVTDLKKYRYNPDVEPKKAWPPEDEDIAKSRGGAGVPPGVMSKL